MQAPCFFLLTFQWRREKEGVFLVSTCLTASLYPQDANLLSSSETREGIPFIQNYPPDQYRADGQNWTIAQDQRGILYFGNSAGILEYDGVNWQLIETENKTVVLFGTLYAIRQQRRPSKSKTPSC